MKHPLIRIWSILLLAGCSCKPNPNKQPHLREAYISQEFKDYAYFKNGTWWIYHDSLTNTYDTVQVYESFNRVDTLVDFDDNPCYFETLSYREKHSADNSVIHNYYDYGPWLYGPNSNKINNLHSERIVKYIFNEDNGPAFSFFTPVCVKCNNYITSEDSIWIDSILPTVDLKGKTYDKTIKILDTNNDLWPPYYYNNFCKMHSMTYWSKNIGVIRRILTSDSLNRDWKLIKYEIIK